MDYITATKDGNLNFPLSVEGPVLKNPEKIALMSQLVLSALVEDNWTSVLEDSIHPLTAA